MDNVLVVSVHPDDETLGCGGTLLKHKEQGDRVSWLILTGINDPAVWGVERISRRDKEIESVAEGYGFEDVVSLGFDTTGLDRVSFAELTGATGNAISKLKPTILYTQNRSDIHSDHRVSFEAIMSAAKSFNHQYITKVLMCETLSETEFAPPFEENAFLPNYFVDITEHLERKIEIMRIYESEVGSHPFPRSERNIRALATFRGAQCGVGYAEAFMILKSIWK